MSGVLLDTVGRDAGAKGCALPAWDFPSYLPVPRDVTEAMLSMLFKLCATKLFNVAVFNFKYLNCCIFFEKISERVTVKWIHPQYF